MSDKEDLPPIMSFDTEVEITVSPAEVVRFVPHDRLFDFLVAIDDEAEDWDLTLALAEHFAALKETYLREVGEEKP